MKMFILKKNNKVIYKETSITDKRILAVIAALEVANGFEVEIVDLH